jgi:predicted AlkP superfamily phosphohydrolase/phosphomutase
MYHELKDYIVRVNDLSNEDLKKVNFTIAKVDYYKGFEEKLNPWDYAKDKTFLSIAHHLIDKKTDFDLFSLFLYGVDSACHTYWPFLEEATNTEKYIEEVMSLSDDPKFIEDSKGFSECIPKYYEFVDEELGKLLKKIDDDCNIIIISDHGFDLDGTQHSFSPDGLLIASSPYIKKDAKLENPSIYNILPTLLALLGVPVGQDFEKDVLSGLLTEDFLRKYLPKYISSHKHYGKKMKKEDTSLDKETEQVMKKRLRALGYIE